jgi:hypothetical protein
MVFHPKKFHYLITIKNKNMLRSHQTTTHMLHPINGAQIYLQQPQSQSQQQQNDIFHVIVMSIFCVSQSRD